jgi:hypothetical protein
VDIYGMDAGNYAATITISGLAASNSPQTVAVVLSIVPPLSREIALADASAILDMSLDLPARFDRVDAASEGMSNRDLGLGPEFSEVELFLSDEPFQMVLAYMTIAASRVERAAMDEWMRDEEQLKSSLLYWLEVGFLEEGMEVPDVELHVTYPKIGQLAAMASGEVAIYGMREGVEILIFKNDEVYVSVCQVYLGSGVPLVPLAEGINQRIEAFSKG